MAIYRFCVYSDVILSLSMDHGGPSIAQVAVVSVDPCRRPSFCHGASLLRNGDCVSCVPIVFPSVGVQKPAYSSSTGWKKTTWRLSIRRPLLPIKTLVVVHFDVPVPVAGCPLASTQPFHNQSCVGQFFSFDRTPISCKSFWFSFYPFILIRYRVSGRKETVRRILIGSKTCV